MLNVIQLVGIDHEANISLAIGFRQFQTEYSEQKFARIAFSLMFSTYVSALDCKAYTWTDPL